MGARDTGLDTSGLSEAEIAALEEDDDQSTDDVDGVADVDGAEDDEDSDNADSDNADDADEEEQDTGTDSDDDQDTGTGEENQTEKPNPKSVQDTEKATDEDKSGDDDASGTTTASPSIDDQIKALDKKLDEGEIDFDTYKKELLLINSKEIRAEVAQEYARLKAEETWQTEQKEFFKDNEYLKENQIVFGAFAAEVNRKLADKAWASRSGTEILAAAKEAIDFAFKLGQAKEEAPVKDDKGKQAVKAAKQASKKDAPQTLKSVPAAEINQENKFAYLDNLTGVAYEKAVAQLSEAEMEEYSRM